MPLARFALVAVLTVACAKSEPPSDAGGEPDVAMRDARVSDSNIADTANDTRDANAEEDVGAPADAALDVPPDIPLDVPVDVFDAGPPECENGVADACVGEEWCAFGRCEPCRRIVQSDSCGDCIFDNAGSVPPVDTPCDACLDCYLSEFNLCECNARPECAGCNYLPEFARAIEASCPACF